MASRDEIERLARSAGIEPTYEDAWEKPQRLSNERLRRLLELLRVPAHDDEQIEASIARLEAESWQRVLPPVRVVREEATPELPVVLPRDAVQAATLRWHVKCEDGAEHQGAVEAHVLVAADEARIEGRWLERRLLRLPEFPCGVHGLRLESDDGSVPETESRLIVAPKACYLPRSLETDGRTWGFAVQLYALRSPRNWGIGDFTDLFDLVEIAQGLGAGIIGVNPLHALFPCDPRRASPYAPSSRLFLNVLYVDVERVPDYAECPDAQSRVDSKDFQRHLEELRRGELVDYEAVAACKLEILEQLYAAFRARHLSAPGGERGAASDSSSEGTSESAAPRGQRFRRFQRERGTTLRAFATFEALNEQMSRKGAIQPWEEWPAELRDPDSAAVRELVDRHLDRVEYYEYLQWVASEQLAEVASRCEALDMPVGLYLDLAIGVARDGADVWADQAAYVAEATVGAPPDAWNPMGQDWGLPPLHPGVLPERAYEPWREVLEASMKYAGALRIDHVLALMHLYWTPAADGPEEGGYVRYALEDMLGVLALHSRRCRCVVVGEDLGTVPRSFKERLQDDGILSYRLLYFEKDKEGRFLAPAEYPRLALAAVSTHDLPTLPGYWVEHDLKLRDRLDLFPSPDEARQAFEERARDRRALLGALADEGLWQAAGEDMSRKDGRRDVPQLDQPLVEAVYAYLARAPSVVLMVQLEDVLGQIEQPNVPGTTDEHPNWRRKLAATLDRLGHDPGVVSLARRLRGIRHPH